MSLSGLLLGLINIAIVVAILLLVGAIILWFMSWMGLAVPDMVRKLYIAVVALIALYMLVALLLGIPSLRVIGFHGVADTAVAVLSSGAAADL
jgi:hypothetical protein